MGETQIYLCNEWIKGRGEPKSLEVLTLYTERGHGTVWEVDLNVSIRALEL